MRHAAKSNIGNVIRTTTFQGFIGSPFDPSGIYGCKDASPRDVKTTDETVELVAVPLAIGGERPRIAEIALPLMMERGRLFSFGVVGAYLGTTGKINALE
jgi:hypothetical protein